MDRNPEERSGADTLIDTARGIFGKGGDNDANDSGWNTGLNQGGNRDNTGAGDTDLEEGDIDNSAG